MVDECFCYTVTVPIGAGSSAVLQFSVPEFQRSRLFVDQQAGEAGEMVTEEEQLEIFANQVSLKYVTAVISTFMILKLLASLCCISVVEVSLCKNCELAEGSIVSHCSLFCYGSPRLHRDFIIIC